MSMEKKTTTEPDEKSPLLGSAVSTAVRNDPATVEEGSVTLPYLPSTVIEPPNQYRSRWRSIRIMYLTMFLSAVSFTITMSTIWPYLRVLDTTATPSLLGWVVAAYSIGQLVASPIFGLWSAHRPVREALGVSLALQVGSNLFYAYLLSLAGDRGLFLAIARSLIGFSSGNAAVVRAYVSGATTLVERTSAMANVSIFQSVGFILGPAIQTALVALGYPGPAEYPGIHFDMYTAPAFLATILAVVNLVLLVTVFQEHRINDTGNLQINITDDDEEQSKTDTLQEETENTSPDYIAVFVTMILFFVVFFMFTILETIGTPLVMDMYGWDKPHASLYTGIMLASSGVLAIAVFIVVKILAKWFDARIFLIAGYIFCFIGFFIFLPWGHELPVMGYAPFNTPVTHTPATPIMISSTSTLSGSPVRWVNVSDLAFPVGHISGWTEHMEQEYFQDSLMDSVHVTVSSTASGSNATNSTVAPEGCPWSFGWCGKVPRVLLGQYIGGSVAISIGYPICNVMTYTLFSKVLGPQPQGLWMGYLTATGSLARTLGPIFVSQVYDAWGPRITFVTSCGVILFTIGLCIVTYRRLLPFGETPFRRKHFK